MSDDKNEDENSLFGSSDEEDNVQENQANEPTTGNQEQSNMSDVDEDNQGQEKTKRRLRKGKTLRKSGTEPPTTEQGDDANSFIDSDDDNPDVAADYAQQKVFQDEEDPFKDDLSAKGGQDMAPIGADEDAEMDKIMKKIKASRKKKGDGMTEEEREDFVHSILLKMDAAYNADLECHRQRRPALNKVKLLNTVVDALSKSSLQTIFLEKNLLQVLGCWLRPSIVNGSLPDLTVRNKLYRLLPRLPIESDQLRRAEFGKLIAYLRDCKKETDYNRAKLKKLVQTWARMIFGKTDNFKMLSKLQSHSGVEEQIKKPRVQRRRHVESAFTKMTSDSPASKKDNQRYRATIPQPRDFQFTKRVTENKTYKDNMAKQKSSGRHEALAKRLKSKKVKRKR